MKYLKIHNWRGTVKSENPKIFDNFLLKIFCYQDNSLCVKECAVTISGAQSEVLFQGAQLHLQKLLCIETSTSLGSRRGSRRIDHGSPDLLAPANFKS